MKRRLSIVFTVAALMMSVSLFAFSVYAALNQTFSISNTISFTSTNVVVNVKGRISGSLQTDITTPPEGFDSIEEYLASKNLIYSGSADGNANLPVWEITESLNFVYGEDSGITYSLEIENLSEFAIKVYFIDFVESTANIENIVSSTVDNFSTIDGAADGQAEGSKKTITILTKVRQLESGFTESNNFKVVIERLEA